MTARNDAIDIQDGANSAAREAISPHAIMRLGFGFWGSKTLLSAVELGLFTHLADGPLSAEMLRARMHLHQRSFRDFLDALVALGMLERKGQDYSNTPAANVFLDRRKPSYVGGILEMANARLYPFWGALTEALRTGEPQNEAKQGRDLFDELYSDPQRLEGFLKAMTGLSLGAAAELSKKFQWRDYKSFVDIGTAQGALPVQIASDHPHLTGLGFDLPMVRPHFDTYVAEHALAGRLSFCGGDFFTDALPVADVVVMGHVLHDWSIDRKRALIAKAYEALPRGGALIVYDPIIDNERRSNAFGLLMSLNMLIETREGSDFTAADCMGWMQDAGFKKTSLEHLIGPDSMIVGTK
jgi:O-methyltransferase domain/Dimerisation domain